MTELLVAILVLIILARATEELMQRLGQLAILGELLGGDGNVRETPYSLLELFTETVMLFEST